MIFLSGIPRSGTSLLYKTLLRHPTFKITSQSTSAIQLSIETHAFANIKKGLLPERLDEFFLFSETFKRDFIESTKFARSYQSRMQKIYALVARKTNSYTIRKIAFKASMSHIILRSFFNTAQEARGAERLIEKTPSNIRSIPEIQATFPKSKIIFLYRHPVDVFSSFKKRLSIARKKGEPENSLTWLAVSPERFCKDYRHDLEMAFLASQRIPENFMFLKYEDFVANPESHLKNICSFLDEEYDEAMLLPDDSRRGTAYSPYLGGKIVTKTKDWSDFIDKDDVVLLERNLQALMEHLEFPKYIVI
jgi:hypothetical protein